MGRLSLLICVFVASPVFAQTKQPVLPVESEPEKMLYRYLQGQAKKHFDERRKAVAGLKTPEDIGKRQAVLKAKFLEALGGFPEKTPLNAKVVGVFKGTGFRVEKVIYESRPNHHVTANFYIPDGKGPFPGVLVPCGHSANGKAAEAYQRACILMARNGLAVLCYDPIGQGERIQLLDTMGKPAIPGSTSEHTMVGVGALLVGQSTATYRIWDGIRSIDYLASRPEIDPEKLGCTGNSGGGTLTSYLMALDDRIVAAAPSCYLTTLEKLFATIGPQDAEQNITGQVAFGMEHADYVTMRAPRPTLIAVATKDFFDIDGAWTTFREASGVYSKLGHGERVALFEYDDGHGFSKPRREACMRWMRRWLLGIDDAPKEGDFPVFKDADLRCTRSGQVLEDFKGRSAFHLNVERAEVLAKQRADFVKLPKEKRAQEIRRLLGLPAKVGAASVATRPMDSPKDAHLYQVVFTTEPGIQVPGLWQTGIKKAKELVIVVHDEGYTAAVKEMDRLGRNGKDVLAIDLRGYGETAPGKPGKKPGYFGVEWKEAFLALHLNRPLLGQRVRDLLAVVEHLAKTPEGYERIHVHATGGAGVAALHAAALDPRIHEVVVERNLASWNNVVRTPISNNQLANVVPGVLQVYDVPDLLATLADRKVVIRDSVDATGRAVPEL